MTKEQKFYQTLRNIFIGAKIEGQGGFINLMKIKSMYYSKIEELLKKDIDDALIKYPDFREELFDKLYSFFSRYFSESGSIYFNSTPFHNNVYEKVYSNDKDVVLFWKTHMLYYVKTDRIFRSMPVEFDNKKFYFDASTIENKKANEKRSLIYELKEIKDDKTIVFNVNYSEKGRVTKNDEILKEIKKKHINITEEDLERAFRIFERQSEVDFFINKNAKAFLQEQIKLWCYQYFWEGAKEWTADRVNELAILKDIAFKIIDFVSQFEDELVKIWNKPKFVKSSNYVITLDRIASKPNGIEIIEKILSHNAIEQQLNEWEDLGFIDENFDKNQIIDNDVLGKKLNSKFQFLPIDTKYFKDLEIEILDLFDDLDNSLDGWLIKSENYQALNTIKPKFKEKVQTIYIDPPFNKEQDADYFYSVKYKDSTWATMLENRLRLARELLSDKGSIFVRCDYNGNWIVRPLMDEIFGEENFRNNLALKRYTGLPKTGGVKFEEDCEYLIYFCKDQDQVLFNQLLKKIEPKWMNLSSRPSSIEKNKPIVIEGKEFYPPKFQRWALSQETVLGLLKEGRAKIENDIIKILIDKSIIGTNWTDISGYSVTTGFKTENSEILLKRVIESTSNKGDLVMDFFLGSGTTTAVAHKLKRKWIGVEMGEHFYTVVLPRMKKVMFYDKSGISKEKDVRENYNENKAGGFFKYYELEQYEETLANTVYENHDMFIINDKNPYEQYVFMKDEKMLRALEIDYKNNKVKVDLDKLYKNIDIPETLSNLTGKWIRKIRNDEVEFEDGTVINTKDLDYKLIKPLIWWE